MVGGEQANNEEVKERRKKRKKYAEERRKKLLGEYDCLTITCFFINTEFLHVSETFSLGSLYVFGLLWTVH